MQSLTKIDLIKAFKEYGVVTQDGLKIEISRSEKRTAIRITKAKNDLSQRIAEVAINESSVRRVDKLEERVSNLESMKFA
ncbi:hypothetical protein A2422_02175 [Candidatus Woesebacteria bacterium RIFOXYC1_FULL_31_51]|uniref:Uncharacterized protein n=1 Tax=Candidatus Woesebacteria bacterium GW2011_GWC2_31_9 TaxID=1618586 RepID=A0A0F9YHI1_9BACT|nr:MAG: hypothetical protein UR17_C0001G0894 [Candidatus Woesebacteria bacterium GW2011_GWF1_31_35]KKP23563.1 MAG: hypothetical protein UR11_C0001G0537 [Candidatus Woesebacteria bacterium GW2011_GWC1_30_29]KKP25190.1 MAG: hypothetical protein UR13_C0011G0015 [Candidatus Woesebacteria bacterium GW2011_GWD1_31_12]KKP27839.1 MAG: hypothetical protein UR16_C0002G0169 [Candidatus Woesebacteria bacterium GW2011_GWB1_31_29]KKP31049.1 MAG: hypothetical protein UR21_C0017G0007 [Candidatus Woesebacteria 